MLEITDLSDDTFNQLIEKIYAKTKTTYFKDVLQKIHKNYSHQSKNIGKNVVRFLIQKLRTEDCEKVMVNKFKTKQLTDNLYLASGCYPFEKKPFLSNLINSKTNNDGSLIRVLGDEGLTEVRKMLPYLKIRSLIEDTGEIYYNKESVATDEEIHEFNSCLDRWEGGEGHTINHYNDSVFIESYEKSTLNIIQGLLELSCIGNAGQEALNEKFIKDNMTENADPLKVVAIKKAFVKSKLLMIYGAAGTGKTFLINCLSNLMGNRRKLFMTKTHTARQNLVRNIKNPGVDSEFISIDKFTKRVNLPDYDVIFVDECSTIDNLTMERFLGKINPNTFVVLAGDIHQIESINFGNWFYYAKNIITESGTNVELLSTWRTKDEKLKILWNEVRNKKGLITEMLALDGPFSENIGSKIFESGSDDEVVLCLNYDGKFGLNNINAYFQNSNNQGPPVSWKEWTYKKGDYILFNDTERFKFLYNNLKGRVVDIVDNKQEKKIEFTIEVNAILTEQDCRYDDIEYIETIGEQTRVRFSVFTFEENTEDPDEQIGRELCVVPFQLAYAVSIHKAQGLEYDSVKIIIPKVNSEKITHSIFYTAITRAKKNLKIYWSTESMNEIVDSFSMEYNSAESLKIIKEKLKLI